MKKLTAYSAFAALLVLLAAAPEARAQTTLELGPRVSYEIDDLEAPAIGADLRISTVRLPVVINPAFDYYFLNDDDFGGVDVSFFQFTTNALFEFGFDNQMFTPYAGPGLSISRLSAEDDFTGLGGAETEIGLNLVGGAKFGIGSLQPFVQAQFTVGGDYEPASITGGLLFRLGQ